MRKEQIAEPLRRYLVPVEGKPNVMAMVAPATPRRLPPGGSGTPVLLSGASMALGRLAGAIPHWQNPDLLTRTLARREAVQSSQIEGTQTELDELLTYEVTQDGQDMPPDVRVTQQYVKALQYGLDAVRQGGRQAITLALIHQLHAILMQGERESVPKGQYRTTQAWIGAVGGRIEDARFVPSPPAYIAESMAELERSMLQYRAAEDEQFDLSIIAQVAIAHAQFETIHPYGDGNGRVGRLLMPLVLTAEGYPPLYLSGPLMRNKLGYYEALSGVQTRGDWAPWMDMVSRSVVEAADEAQAIAEDLQQLVEEWNSLVKGHRRDSVASRLPQLLVDRPVVSVKQVAALLDVSFRAALTGIDHLVEYGILSPKDERKWGRTFHAEAVLERLNQVPDEPRNRLRM